jgi:hypothetical protein
MHLMGCKMIVMTIAPLIRHKMVAAAVEMKSAFLRPPRQKECLQGIDIDKFKNNIGPTLLLHKFFCKREWRW